MYTRCKLVHADLSEYNLLYHDQKVYVIDVSQAVENDHPMALYFLRRDCSIIRDFFQKKLERVLTTQSTFDFVTDINIQDDTEEDLLVQLLEEVSEQTIDRYEENL